MISAYVAKATQNFVLRVKIRFYLLLKLSKLYTCIVAGAPVVAPCLQRLVVCALKSSVFATLIPSWYSLY